MILKTKILSALKNRLGKDSVEFLSHGIYYIVANFFAKAIIFFILPVYTRLITPVGFGVLSIYITITQIFEILMILNIDYAVNRYFFEPEGNFPEFVGTNLVFLSILNVVFLVLFYCLRKPLAAFFVITDNLFYYAILVAVSNGFLSLLMSYLQAARKSRIYALILIVKNSLSVGLAILFILLLKNNRYMGDIYGKLLISLLIFPLVLIYLIRIGRLSFRLKYLVYALKYGIPLIPHVISSFILAQFDRIIINQIYTEKETGLYSFAYQIGVLMYIIVASLNRSWGPIFYTKRKEEQKKEITQLARKYTKYISLLAVFLILFSREITFIMADKKYHTALGIIPVIVLSYVFLYLQTLYTFYAFYHKKTFFVSLSTISAGILNIVLNYWLLPHFGYFAAAYTTLISFFVSFLLNYIHVRFMLRDDQLINLKDIILLLLPVLPAVGLFYVLNVYLPSLLGQLFIKAVLVLVLGYVMFFRKRKLQ